MSIRVRVNEIPEEGLTVSERFDAGAMNLQTEELRFTAPLDVTARFARERDAVMVGVGIEGAQELICSRCLTPFDRPYHLECRLGYTVRGVTTLDVTDDVRQEILLSYPVKLLCRQDCRGLCPGCGVNLNEEPCRCENNKGRFSGREPSLEE